MTERDIESALLEMTFQTGEDGEPIIEGLFRAASFEARGVMTHNRGVVWRMKDGSEFQITIVQSAPPDPDLANEHSDDEAEGGQ